VPQFRGQSFFVDNFEINQARPACFLVINHIVRAGIAMRPRAAKLITPELVCSPEFPTGGFHHFSCECALT